MHLSVKKQVKICCVFMNETIIFSLIEKIASLGFERHLFKFLEDLQHTSCRLPTLVSFFFCKPKTNMFSKTPSRSLVEKAEQYLKRISFLQTTLP